MSARTFSASHQGIDGLVLEIEAVAESTKPAIVITGLPNEVIRESKERVRACLAGLGFAVPSSRIVVHLSPAMTRKEGSQLDVAIAVCLLAAEGLLPAAPLRDCAILGELALDGRIRPVRSALALIEALENAPAVRRILLPKENGWEAALLQSRKARIVETLIDVLDHVHGRRELASPPLVPPSETIPFSDTLDRVIGQSLAKRALQIALAGDHHLLLIGPPGVGKTLLASCAPTLLPPLTPREWISVMKNYYLVPAYRPPCLQRPFRSPHHTVSAAGLLGGGSGTVVPGEVTLAHGGVLFLDEFPEFSRTAIEGLREPLQNGTIHLHRVGTAVELPARFTLIAAMNPCPCGHALSKHRRCRCTPDQIRSYQKRVSGPILDRIDLCVVMGPPMPTESFSAQECRSSIARARLAEDPPFDTTEWLKSQKFSSYRAKDKLARVAKTIARLEGAPVVRVEHLQEAKAFECPDWYAPSLI